MYLGNNLKRIRKENNLSQEQLADKIGVSRQAVSKWESGLAYPEMEKMVVLCQIFNLNIDELLNQDLKEVNEAKQTRCNINKYIDDFLNFITKTIDMFSSMKFKTKVKCLFEQFLIIASLAIILLIIGSIGGMIVQDILLILPDQAYYIIDNIIRDIYIIICLILSLILTLHIFKIRYLDYYIIVNDKDASFVSKNDPEEQISANKIYLEREKNKIIIRDPENSSYKFISLLFKVLLFMIKLFIFFTSIMFSFNLIFLFLILVLSLLFVKTGMTFIGVILVILGSIIINLIILNISYNFIVNKKSKKNFLALSFVISLILLGIGSGLFCIGLTEFEFTNTYNDYIKDEVTIPYNDNLTICEYYDINYIASDNNNLRIVYEHSKYYDLKIENIDNSIHFDFYSNYSDIMDVIRVYIKDINNKKIIDYSTIAIDIYTTKENIERINNNSTEY